MALIRKPAGECHLGERQPGVRQKGERALQAAVAGEFSRGAAEMTPKRACQVDPVRAEPCGDLRDREVLPDFRPGFGAMGPEAPAWRVAVADGARRIG